MLLQAKQSWMRYPTNLPCQLAQHAFAETFFLGFFLILII